MSQELLEGRWDETREALLEGLSGSKRNSMSVILENTKKYSRENASSGSTVSGNIATLNRVILPVIRRVMPTVIANELVGVQPMTGPVGQIHTLRVRYAQSLTDNSAAQTSVTAGEEALSPFKIAQAYSTVPQNEGTATTYTGAATATLEGNGGKQISVQILKQAVEAKTRKLQARWTFEAAQDAQSQHGIDVEAEIMAALAQEITAEIDQEILLWSKSKEMLGEFTIVIAGYEPSFDQKSDEEIAEIVRRYESSGITRKEAIAMTAKELHIPKRKVFDIMVLDK